MSDRRLMLVENECSMRRVLRVALRVHQLGQIVGEAATSADANLVAAEERPDVIVLDLHLPDSHGRPVYEGIRRASPGSRVVIFSGHESEQHWYERQGVPFVPKIAGVDELVRAINSA